MSTDDQDDLGFVYRITKDGKILISHTGKLATTLRGSKAIAFRKKLDGATFSQQQQLMARLTGNYKRGNEKLSKLYAKNKV